MRPQIASRVNHLDGEQRIALRKGPRRGDEQAELDGTVAARHKLRKPEFVHGACPACVRVNRGTTGKIVQGIGNQGRFAEVGRINSHHAALAEGGIAVTERAVDLHLQIRATRGWGCRLHNVRPNSKVGASRGSLNHDLEPTPAAALVDGHSIGFACRRDDAPFGTGNAQKSDDRTASLGRDKDSKGSEISDVKGSVAVDVHGAASAIAPEQRCFEECQIQRGDISGAGDRHPLGWLSGQREHEGRNEKAPQ